MLKQDNGEYACIAEDTVRYNLGEVKEEMLAAMGLNTEVCLTFWLKFRKDILTCACL
jgi:hypothetical protein